MVAKIDKTLQLEMYKIPIRHFIKEKHELVLLAEKILTASIDLFSAKEVKEKEVLIDTTVQEKNITYPTDTKLQKKIIEKCREIAGKEDIKLRQSDKRILKQLMIDQRFREHPESFP